jgi:APA family basic amino acid/polyamine antiporter
MFSLPVENWWRLIAWLLLGFIIYFTYSRHHSIMRRVLRGEVVVPKDDVTTGGTSV